MKGLFRALLVLFLLSVMVFPTEDSQADTSKRLGTGLKHEDAKGREWLNRKFPRAVKIRPNSLALARTNTERAQRKLPLLDSKKIMLGRFGEEAVFGAASRAAVAAVVPTSVDNSLLAAFPPIRSQGAVGSCAAWATTYYQFTHETNLVSGMTAKAGDNNNIFSPKWAYNMVNGGVDGGSYFSANYSVLLNNGAAKWAAFPYDSNYRQWSLNPVVWRDAINYRLQSSGSLYYNTSSGLDAIKQQLANGHVLVVGTYITSFQYKAVSNDLSTANDDPFVGQAAVFFLNGTAGAHGMTFVGYNDDIWIDVNGNGIMDAGEKGAFKVANSWGTGYKNAGYVWVAYDALNTTSSVAGGPSTSRVKFLQSDLLYFVTARTYRPQYVAEFSVNHLKRSQMAITLGTGEVGSNSPTATWRSGMLSNQGGSYAFDGTTIAVDGTFAIDFTSVFANPAPGSAKRLFLNVSDSVTGDPVTVKSFRILDGNGVVLGEATDVPFVVDATTSRSYVDYIATIDGNYPPLASVNATPTSGDMPLVVNFSGIGSVDKDGTIVAYNWDFGNGVYASGQTTSYAYDKAGSFLAKLTVVDDKGVSGSTTVGIVVNDPNRLLAPSSLTATASKRVVSLRWTDNSSNEDGFYLERGLKSKGAVIFQRVSTLPANTASFSDTVSAGGTYQYRVAAYKISPAANEYSNIVELRVK